MAKTDNDYLPAEEIACREYEAMADDSVVRVKVGVSWKRGMCLPDSKCKDQEEATFRVLTLRDSHILNKACSYEVEIDGGLGRTTVMDINEYRRLLVKRTLVSWSIGIPIERVGGWITQQCWDRVKKIPAPLMDAFIDGFETKTSVSNEEEEKIMKQCSVLFSKNNRGIADACEAVGMFCTLGNFWEKFGIGKGKPIDDMPYKEYVMLKMVMGREGEATRTHSSPRKPLTRIASAGGKPRASRGIVVEE